MFTRRDALLTALFGAGHIGLRALATGLPAWFIADPRKASAQSLECAIAARDKLQYLIVSASSMGDPINCNCPGTYETDAAVHPEQAEMAPTKVRLGAKTYTAARPWASTQDGGGLSQAVLDRTCFFHHMTGSTVHGDQPKVMKLMGATSQGEMIVSAYAKYLASCFGTIQTEPVAVGARNNASELLSFAGRTLPSIAPTQLRQLLTGSRTDPLVQMRSIRDSALDELYALAKTDATNVQLKFLDELAATQQQVRLLADQLADTLSSITSDDVQGQALAAAALISAKVTPVVTLRIPFGGDNHSDNNLQAEVDQHVTGTRGIQAVMDALAALGLTDQVTFATLNVFGRNLNGIAKVEGRQGRDHYGNHSVGVLIGKNIAPGVIGGVTPIKNGGFGVASGSLGASDIDSATGAAVPGGDIPATKTHVAMARTLGVALGIPEAQLESSFVASAGGRVVKAALSGISG